MSKIASSLKSLNSAVKTGSIRALNKAVSSAKSRLAKAMRQDTGLTSKVIGKRLLARKANVKKLNASLNIAVKYGVPLKDLKAKEKRVRVKHRGGRKAQVHTGVTIKIGSNARTLAPGVFPLVGKTGEAMLGRKQAFSKGTYIHSSGPKYKTFTPKLPVVLDSAIARKTEIEKHMQDTFDKNVHHEIEYAVSQAIARKK